MHLTKTQAKKYCATDRSASDHKCSCIFCFEMRSDLNKVKAIGEPEQTMAREQAIKNVNKSLQYEPGYCKPLVMFNVYCNYIQVWAFRYCGHLIVHINRV